MKKKIVLGSILVILAIVFGPVVLKQFAPLEERTLQRVYLADVEYDARHLGVAELVDLLNRRFCVFSPHSGDF